MTILRDKLWLWAHPAGAHNGRFGLPGHSSISPAQASEQLGIPNVIMVAFGNEPRPPFDAYARTMQHRDRLVWSIVGDSSSTRNDGAADVEAVIALADLQPNLVGGIMDDFFVRPKAGESDAPFARYSVAQVEQFATQLHGAAKPLDLWVVLYDHELDLPVQDHLAVCDVVTYWTWKARDLDALEANFDRAQAMAPGKRFLLGVYLWDFGEGEPMPIDALERQCELGLQWCRDGRSEGMIFLASCIVDMGLEAVEWARGWIARVSDDA